MEGVFRTGLKVRNSLSGALEEFVPHSGRRVSWYICGPTVYSHTHLGHARNYVCCDMIRRVMQQHFGYRVFYCMNITNIDDKIIHNSLEAKQNYFDFTLRWENEFFRDMKSLGNLLPDAVFRVSEYVPEIVDYIQTLISKQYAYESNGSVYFDLTHYSKDFEIGRLKLNVVQDSIESTAEGFESDKKDKRDFVLWKKAKENEPFWESPWGRGRPGWHIECSAMSHHVVGPKLDIHSGGVDLKFPHHENEIAQSCAFNSDKEWTRYFLHTGHLHIKGKKMSKSLKNFMTVKEILELVNARVVRLFFALHRYDSLLNFSEDVSLDEAKDKDRKFKELFLKLRGKLGSLKLGSSLKFQQKDKELQAELARGQDEIHQHFKNNFDFPAAISVIDGLVAKANSYLNDSPKVYLVQQLHHFFLRFFSSLGISYELEEGSTGTEAKEQAISILSCYRDKVRKFAVAKDFQGILQATDEVRDEQLPTIGVRLEDGKVGDAAVWKLDDPEVIIKQKKEKAAEKKRKEEAKIKAEEERKRREAQKLRQMQIKAQTMYLQEKEKYSEWDERGIPTKDKEGNALKEKLRKKLEKGWQQQKSLNEKYQNQVRKN